MYKKGFADIQNLRHKQPRQILAANNYGKFSRQIVTRDDKKKITKQNLAKLLRQE